MEMTDYEVVQEENELEFIKRDHLWPHGLLLPVDRPKKGEPLNLELGIVFFMDKTTVILDNIFFYNIRTMEEKLNLEKIKYSSIEDLLVDGWKIS